MAWMRMSDAERKTLSQERDKVLAGIPCPWCDQLIEYAWTKYVYVASGLTGKSAARGIFPIPPPGLVGTFCACPHCKRDFELRVKEIIGR